jgi:hypothetical protein
MSDPVLMCASEDHPRPVAAIARLYWPDGRYKPITACIGDLTRQIRQSLDGGHPVEVWPADRGPADPRRGDWRSAPDCGRCKDTGRFREGNDAGGCTEAHCGCKRGRRMSELWYADKHGLSHPDEPEPEPSWGDDDPPF